MLKNLKVRTRLILMLGLALLALTTVGAVGLINGHRTRLEIDHVYIGGADKMVELVAIQNSVSTKLVNPLIKLRDGQLTWEEASLHIRAANEMLDTNWNKYVVGDLGLDAQALQEHRQVLEKMTPAVTALDTLLSKLQDAIQNQNKEIINALTTKELFPTIDALSAGLNQLVNLHATDTTRDYQEALDNAVWFQTTTLCFLAASIIALTLFTALIISSVVKPIEYVAKRIESGDTKTDIQISSGGELGSLLDALRSMFQSLNKVSDVLTAISKGDLTVEGKLRSDSDVLGHALHDMVTQMRIMIGDIKGEVISLTSSSQEIMTSLSHISTGAAETASAVTETTTTIEELKQTANVSVEKAKDVLTNAKETMQAVTSSEASVMATIEDMNQIRERMQIISDSILKLSEKGNAIAEIMDSVNDIAEQSNLLAVNAAIEAVKAGEVGRSFGVVAQEIRTLAEQSKGATVQVRSLLGEIQSATSAAVLATEQGSKAVTKGVSQSVQTSKTIKELTSKMTSVTQATNQIVLSNQQQLIGTEQITVAMTQISEATNQHVDHLKQIETAVANLNQVGGTLKALTDKYRLAEDLAPLAHMTPLSSSTRREQSKQFAHSDA